MRSRFVLPCLLAVFLIARVARADRPVVIAHDAIQPHVAIDSAGSCYVAFIHGGNICVSVSTDAGKSFSHPVVAIDVKGRAKGGMQRGPRIAVDAKRRITVTAPVTFDDAEYKKRYPTADLYLVQSSDGGKTWSPPLQVNEVSKKAPEALHWMAAAPSGEVHVAWLDLRDRTGPGQDIFFATVVNGRVGKNFKVATTVCECCAPGLAVDAAGNPFIAFREGAKKPSRELFAIRSTDRGASFGKPVRINSKESLEDG